MAPLLSMETLRASPLRTSTRVATVQMDGSEAREITEKDAVKKARTRNVFIMRSGQLRTLLNICHPCAKRHPVTHRHRVSGHPPAAAKRPLSPLPISPRPGRAPPPPARRAGI